MAEKNEGLTATALAALVGGRVGGDGATSVRRVSSIEAASEGTVVFVEDTKLLEAALASGASCVIVPEGAEGREGAADVGPAAEKGAGRCVIYAKRPKLAFALMAEALHPSKAWGEGVHPTAIVEEDAVLGVGVYVGPCAVVGRGATLGAGTQVLAGAVVGAGVKVGSGCLLHPNVVLYEGVTLGDRVVLHAGVVVGADGFGYVRDAAGVYHKFPQVGSVVIEDDVEIGAQTCIDRGALGETRIGRGTKIDNLVQIGHNVRVGEDVVIAAQTGVSGSTVIESEAVIGGQVGMGDHARVERGAVIGSKAGILPGKIVRAGTVQWGVPVRPLDEYKRLNALWGRLPRMRDEIEELKRQVRELTERLPENE
jgi:UDP-3-O-[3-hydroxymyristoyl] glucosamine N-acyltransferase